MRSQIECQKADPGHFVDATASNVQHPCPSGYYQANYGGTSCTPAPLNSFVLQSGSIDYIPCSLGGETIEIASTSSLDCIYDSDNDGILDSHDKLKYIPGQNLTMPSVVLSVLSSVLIILFSDDIVIMIKKI